MFDPVGPLPESVYRRRQAVALGGVVALLMVLIWGIGSIGGDEQPLADERAMVASATSTPPSTSSSAAPSSPAVPGAVPGTGPGAPGTVPGFPGLAAPATPALPPPLPPPPAAPTPCAESALGVAAQTDRPEYQVGERPVFRLVVTNLGAVPCIQDLSAEMQEMVVTGAERMWSSNDCAVSDTKEVRTLAPGEQVAFPLTWAGRTSRPGCPEDRVSVPAGDYQLVTRLGQVLSAPVPFRLVE